MFSFLCVCFGQCKKLQAVSDQRDPQRGESIKYRHKSDSTNSKNKPKKQGRARRETQIPDVPGGADDDPLRSRDQGSWGIRRPDAKRRHAG